MRDDEPPAAPPAGPPSGAHTDSNVDATSCRGSERSDSSPRRKRPLPACRRTSVSPPIVPNYKHLTSAEVAVSSTELLQRNQNHVQHRYVHLQVFLKHSCNCRRPNIAHIIGRHENPILK